MAVYIVVNIPPLVGTRNERWVSVQVGVTSLVKVEVFSGATLLTTLSMPPDATGKLDFNLKRILECMGVVPNTIDADLPAFNQAAISVCTRNIKPFSVIIYEISRVDNSIIHQVTMSANCLLAGLNPELAYSTTLLDFISGPVRKFLTNKPKRKLTSTTTQEYLYYFNSNLASPAVVIALMLKLNYTDGSSSAEIVVSSQVMTTALIPVGYQQLNIPSAVPSGKFVASYEVFLRQNGIDTEKHVYEIDVRCYPDGREFLFLNSLGGMDTIRIMQVDDITVKKDSDLVERFVGINGTLTEGSYYEFNVRTNREFKASTALQTAEERRWLQEFFASEKIFEIAKGKFLPVRITTSSMQINKQLATYQSVDFSYAYRFDDIGFTQQ